MATPSKKERIINEAKKMFAQKGYAQTIMDDLANAANVNKATIYYHFKDKATLYEMIFFEGVKKIADRIITQTDQYTQPQEKLAAYIKVYAKSMQECYHLSSILLREIASGGDWMPSSVLAQLLRTTKRLTQILEMCAEKRGGVCYEPMVIQLMIISTLSSFITTKPIRKRVKEELDSSAPTLPVLKLEDIAEKLTFMIYESLQKGENI